LQRHLLRTVRALKRAVFQATILRSLLPSWEVNSFASPMELILVSWGSCAVPPTGVMKSGGSFNHLVGPGPRHFGLYDGGRRPDQGAVAHAILSLSR
jgi:hypothetical protein